MLRHSESIELFQLSTMNFSSSNFQMSCLVFRSQKTRDKNRQIPVHMTNW